MLNPESPSLEPPSATAIPSRPVVPRVGLGLALAAAIVAGLIAWAGGEAIEWSTSVPIVSEFQVSGSQQFARRAAAITTKATLAYSLLGAILSLMLGLAGGWARRSGRWMLLGAVAGLVLGGVAGAGTSRVMTPLFLRNEKPLEDDLILPLLTHGGIWSAVGLACGIALGIGLGGPPSRVVHAALGGLLGAAAATMVYETAGAVLFPLEQTSQPLSTGMGSRLAARLIVALGTALVATLAAQPSRLRSSSVDELT